MAANSYHRPPRRFCLECLAWRCPHERWLTPREVEILLSMAVGLHHGSEIAARCGAPRTTTYQQIKTLRDKIGVNQAELILWAETNIKALRGMRA